MTDREKIIETLRASGYGYFITHEKANADEALAYAADALIADGIGDVSDKDMKIARLTAENQRLKEEAAEQKSIAAHEHATQMEWFRIACDYKAENAELKKRLDKELPCKVGK